jgi:hypothetical protein
MAGTRIKGQETELIFIKNGSPIDSLQNCKSLDFTFKTKILEEGYLGETTQQYDSVFDGVEGNAEFHFADSTPFGVAVDLINKARRREAGTAVNIKTTFSFPSGRRARVVIRNAEFGPIPFSVGGRSEFVSFKLAFSASDAQVLPL